jgi:hypothetical protein
MSSKYETILKRSGNYIYHLFNIKSPELVGPDGTASDLNSLCTLFESRAEEHFAGLSLFIVFSVSVGYDHILPHPFQCIIH